MTTVLKNFIFNWNNFWLIFSKNRINQKTIDLLLELANEVDLKQAIAAQFSGEKINQTEDRAVLHAALRAKENDIFLVDGKNVIPEIFAVKSKMKDFSNEIISGNKKGFTGKAFTDIVNIGIGWLRFRTSNGR